MCQQKMTSPKQFMAYVGLIRAKVQVGNLDDKERSQKQETVMSEDC